MRKTLSITAAAGLLVAALTLPAFAADKVTLTGTGICAKCGLHETDKCQTVLEVVEGGTTNKYYLAQNKVSIQFHEKICQAPEKIIVTGTVKEKDGKKILTAAKIEESK